jgi:hypothetical protein
MLDSMLSHKELFDLYDFPYWAGLEAKYLSKKKCWQRTALEMICLLGNCGSDGFKDARRDA